MSRTSFALSLSSLVVTIVLVVLVSSRGQPVVAKTNLENLPTEIDGFIGQEDTFPPAVNRELDADKQVYRHYRHPGGKQVDLYIGYYGTAKGGRTDHNPNACLSGAGWGILESREVTITRRQDGGAVSVNYVLACKGDVCETFIHWYQATGGKVLASGVQQNFERFLGRVIHNRNDGAFVRVSVPTSKSGVMDAQRLAQTFSEAVMELLPQYWPIEK